MQKEIYDQPAAILETIQRHVSGDLIFPSELAKVETAFLGFKKIIIAASGSSRHAGLAGEIMIEDLSGAAVDVEYASEYCYRSTHSTADPIVMVITQSGETADTIAAQREALARGSKTIAICNVADSTIAREASADLLTYAAPEIAVPATKSFTAQLVVLYLFALFLARKRGRMTSEVVRTHLGRLLEVPAALEQALPAWDPQTAEYAHDCRESKSFLFLGRSVHYAIAREGALKLKEISYTHAEGYPVGELRHGPNALVDEQLPVVVLAAYDRSDPDSLVRYHKTLSLLQELSTHGAKLIVVATEGDKSVGLFTERVIFVPALPELVLPIVEVVPLQLLAYHFALLQGGDVDRPRNLAKSVVRE
jgi:glutamine---fructose-6-phosphate transaminase (isomerizing)